MISPSAIWPRSPPLVRRARERWRAHLAALPEKVYLTFDIDFFDPALVPATGTPEPGGLDWYEACDLLAAVASKKRIVGFDVVELAPLAPARSTGCARRPA